MKITRTEDRSFAKCCLSGTTAVKISVVEERVFVGEMPGGRDWTLKAGVSENKKTNETIKLLLGEMNKNLVENAKSRGMKRNRKNQKVMGKKWDGVAGVRRTRLFCEVPDFMVFGAISIMFGYYQINWPLSCLLSPSVMSAIPNCFV